MYIHYSGVVRNLNLRVQHNEREEEEYFLVSLPQNLQIQFEKLLKIHGFNWTRWTRPNDAPDHYMMIVQGDSNNCVSWLCQKICLFTL